MRLVALDLENFKGIGRRQRIELRPITLLFGPNSAGKSMIIQSLHYLQGILTHGDLDPQSFLDGQIDVGGFRHLVHRHDLGRTIYLTCHLQRPSEGAYPMSFTDDPPWFDREAAEEAGFRPTIQRARLSLGIGFSSTLDAPYLSEVRVAVDGRPLLTAEARAEGGRVSVTEVDFAHPLLANTADYDPESLIATANGLARRKALPLQIEARDLLDALPTERNRVFFALDADPDRQIFEDEEPALEICLQLLSYAVAHPLAAVAKELKHLLHVGPFRTIPLRSFVPHGGLGRRTGDWYTGVAAYAFVAEAAEQERRGIQVASVNDWLGPDHLDTGFAITVSRHRELPEDHWFLKAVQRGDILDVAELASGIIQDLPLRSRLVVTDTRSNVELAPADVGTGFSQVVPIIAAAVSGLTMVAIEQPELHLHPAQQVELADLFLFMGFAAECDYTDRERDVHVAWDKTFLLETHSEHLVLRFARRVRQTMQYEKGFDGPILKPDEIAVHWIEPSPDGAIVRRLRIDEDGDFIDVWPRGFFDERAKELF